MCANFFSKYFLNETASSCEKPSDKELSYKVFRLDSAKRLISSWATQNVLTFILRLGIALGISVAFPYTCASVYIGTKLIWLFYYYFFIYKFFFLLFVRPRATTEKVQIGGYFIKKPGASTKEVFLLSASWKVSTCYR